MGPPRHIDRAQLEKNKQMDFTSMILQQQESSDSEQEPGQNQIARQQEHSDNEQEAGRHQNREPKQNHNARRDRESVDDDDASIIGNDSEEEVEQTTNRTASKKQATSTSTGGGSSRRKTTKPKKNVDKGEPKKRNKEYWKKNKIGKERFTMLTTVKASRNNTYFQNAIARGPFCRLVREISDKCKKDLRWQRAAIDAIHLATETAAVGMFENLAILAGHANRVTVQPKDIDVMRRLFVEDFIGYDKHGQQNTHELKPRQH